MVNENYRTFVGSFDVSGASRYNFEDNENAQMMVVGISSIAYSRNSVGAMSLSITYDQLQSSFLSIASTNTEYTFHYFSMQTLPNRICSNCPDGSILFNQFCVSQCPLGNVVGVSAQGAP
jgi:hypothetical protein